MGPVWDVAIAGGGATGLSLALALRVLSGGHLRVVLIDRGDPAARSGPRTSALAEGPRRMLERLGVWQRLSARAQPIRQMEISDAGISDALKLSLLSFEASNDGEPLAHMLFHRDLEPRLLEAARERGVEIVRDAIERTEPAGSTICLHTQSRASFRARLLVGADGLRSRVRTAARIPVVCWPYDRAALVMTISHEADHNGRAIQHFLEGGPFAALPLTGRRSSIVWTEPTSKAAEYLNFPASLLVEQLDLRMGGCFGEIQIEETAQSFPLVFQVARRFIDQRIALVGDAAHRVHPLAGQGLNLGMRDVATLAEIIMDQARLGLDFGGADSLQNYERRRRFDATANAAAFDLLHKSYAMPGNAAQAVRRAGMNLMNGTGALKSALHREAAGIAGDIPSLFQ